MQTGLKPGGFAVHGSIAPRAKRTVGRRTPPRDPCLGEPGIGALGGTGWGVAGLSCSLARRPTVTARARFPLLDRIGVDRGKGSPARADHQLSGLKGSRFDSHEAARPSQWPRHSAQAYLLRTTACVSRKIGAQPPAAAMVAAAAVRAARTRPPTAFPGCNRLPIKVRRLIAARSCGGRAWGCHWAAPARQAAAAGLTLDAERASGSPTGGRTTRPATGHGTTGVEPGMDGIAIPGIDGSQMPNIPTRMAKPWAWRMRGVDLPLRALALTASDRVPRFSRFRLADSVRFVRFNMARPSHPPASGGIEEVRRQSARREINFLAGCRGGGRLWRPQTSRRFDSPGPRARERLQGTNAEAPPLVVWS
jgi:hypothetical protein